MRPRYAHAIGFDDAPFAPGHRGDVLIVGTVYAGSRLEGVLSGKVRRDGVNATRALAGLVRGSRFSEHLQLVMLQGVAMAGFNVIDLHALHEALQVPVLAVARHAPDLEAMRRALLTRVPGGRRKWRLIERLEPMRPAAGLYLQPVGMSLSEAAEVVSRFALHGNMPEPLRAAHLIAAGIGAGESRHRA